MDREIISAPQNTGSPIRASPASPAFTDRATTSITVILMDSATTESFSATRNASPACISGPSVKAKPIT